MNNIKVTREYTGHYAISLTDYNLTFKVENLKHYGMTGERNWEAKCEQGCGDLYTLFFDSLSSAKTYLKYFRPEEFGVALKAQ